MFFLVLCVHCRNRNLIGRRTRSASSTVLSSGDILLLRFPVDIWRPGCRLTGTDSPQPPECTRRNPFRMLIHREQILNDTLILRISRFYSVQQQTTSDCSNECTHTHTLFGFSFLYIAHAMHTLGLPALCLILANHFDKLCDLHHSI